MKKHPMSPMIEWIGHTQVGVMGSVVSTIIVDYKKGLREIIKANDDIFSSYELPNLYETAINTSPVERYNSRAEALKGHQRWVATEQQRLRDKANEDNDES